jgi:hypothetical protein
MAWVPQVNAHVQVFYVSGSKVKVRPGVVTGIVAGNTVNVRVGHSGQTFASLARRTSPASPPALPYYIAM